MLAFAKYHGLGNDFIVLDRRQGGAPLDASTARALCDRHLGVGADGVLSVWPGIRPNSAVHMQVQNSDGSESEMCGNGLRCVARFLDESDGQRSVRRIEAGKGVYSCHHTSLDRYAVHMGRITFEHPDLPPNPARLQLGATTWVGTAVHVGNPHWVTFLADHQDPLALAVQIGTQVEAHPAFPNRANASFVRDEPDRLFSVVFERGAGVTRACGSGACAIAAAAVRAGIRTPNQPIRVRLPGGTLVITLTDAFDAVMEGEAKAVYRGEIDLSVLAGVL